MVKKLSAIIIVAGCVFFAVACATLRFSQIDPAAKDFHPRSIAVFDADIGHYAEAKGVVEKEVAAALAGKKWFAAVIDNESLNNQIRDDEELRGAMKEYLSKLKTLNFSDPYLSRKISELVKADAFLMVSVDIWHYTVEQDKKVAKVSMGMRLYEGSTGHLMWRAGHHRAERYVLIKPELAAVAKKVASDMFAHMPR